MRRFAAPATAFLIIIVIVAVWLKTGDGGLLRQQLMRWQFLALEAQFVLVVALSWINLPRLVRSLAPTTISVRAAAASAVLTLVLVAGVAPQTNRIYYDEHIYEGVGQSLSDLHLAQMCLDGTVEYGSLQCWRGEYNKEPYGYPYLLSVGYRLFGVRESIAHRLNTLCAVLLVWVVFLTACALYEDSTAGAYAALIAALIPQQILWSHTAAVEPSAALMVAATLMTALHYVRSRTVASLVWMVVMAVFTVQFRTEAILVVPIVLAVVALYAPAEFRRPAFWWVAALGLALGAVHVGHLAAVRSESWGSSEARMSFHYIWPNLKTNGTFYLDNARFPLLTTALALLGVSVRHAKATVVASALFLAFWGVFLFFYAGSYGFGADVRFSLMSYPALAVLAGRGAAGLHELAASAGLDRKRAAGAIVAAVGAQFLWFLPQVRSLGEEAWSARADVAFAKRVMPELPVNAIVLTHNPSIFLLNGVNAAQMSLITTEPTYVVSGLPHRYAGGVYLHWNAWCNYADPVQHRFCVTALESFSSDLVKEYRERDFRYAFYRLRLDATSPKTQP